ncbi:MAG: prenyltransferase [Thermoplasmatota archaeon]
MLEDAIDVLKLGRLHFLFGGFLIYSLGALLAVETGAEGDLMKFIFGYVVFFPAHLSVSYSNDLYDMEADRYNTPSPFSGGSGVLLRRPELAPWAKGISIGLMGVSFILSLIFMFVYGRSVVFPLLVVFGCFLGWSYTGPPLRLAYRRMGEVATVTAVGLVVLFMGFFVMTGDSPSVILFFLLPQLLYGVQFIMNVQIPDMEADRKGGKTTMVVLYGRRFSFIIQFLTAAFATLIYSSVWLFRIGPVWDIMGIMAVISLVPLLASIPSLVLRPRRKEPAVKLVTISMGSMFAFLIIADLYLLLGP